MEQAVEYLVRIESYIMELLHSDNQWMALFHFCSNIFWTGVLALSIFYGFYIFCVFYVSRHLKGVSRRLKGCFSIYNTQDLLTQALENPDHAIHRVIEEKASEAAQASKQDAIEDCVVQKMVDSTKLSTETLSRIQQRYTSLEEELLDAQVRNSAIQEALVNAERRSATNEGLVALLLDQLDTIQRQLRGELLEAHSELMKSNTRSIAEDIIKEADQKRIRMLTMTTTDPDHQRLKELSHEVLDIAASVRALQGTPAKVSELRDEVHQHKDRLESAISKQAATITNLTTTRGLPTAAGADTEIMSKLQHQVNNHNTQLLGLTEISADVDDLKTAIAELNNIPSQIETLDARTKFLEDDAKHQNKSLKKLETSVAGEDGLTERLTKCEDTIMTVHRKVSMSEDVVDGIKRKMDSSPAVELGLLLGKVEQLQGKIDEATTSHGNLATEVADHAEDLARLKRWAKEDADDIKELQSITDRLTADNDSKAEANSTVNASPSASSPGLVGPQHYSPATEVDGEKGADASKAYIETGFTSTRGTEDPQATESMSSYALPVGNMTPLSTSGFDASRFQDMKVNFSVPSSDSPLAFLGDGMSAARPHAPRPFSLATTFERLPAPLSAMASTPQEHVSTSRPLSRTSDVASGPAELVRAVSPSMDEGMEDWQAYAKDGQSFDDFIDRGEEIDRDSDAEMGSGSDRDAEGESDDEDAVFGNGY